MEQEVGEHLGTYISGRRVILSETLVLREGDHEVTSAVQGIVRLTIRFADKLALDPSVNTRLEDGNHIVVDINDAQERGGFTSWSAFKNDAPGPDLLLTIFVDPIGTSKRTRQLSFTLTMGPE
jgi:hypothetical protein